MRRYAGFILLSMLGSLAPVRGDFTLVVLPDTQYYAYLYPPIFFSQTQWIASHVQPEKIAFVLHEGDIVHHNRPNEWDIADDAISLLDDAVPYVLTAGNHDMGWPCCEPAINRDTRWFLFHFPPERFEDKPWYGGYRPGDSENCFVVFREEGMNFMVISLEFGADDDVLAWANQVVAANPDRRVIVLTHAYMEGDGTRLVGMESGSVYRYGVAAEGVNDAQEMWDEFIKFHHNIFMVLSGHSGTATFPASRLLSFGDHGNPVIQILANYQRIDEGGQGFLRLMRFVPSQDKIRVRTYSPWHDQFRINPQDEFTLNYDMGPWGDLNDDARVDLRDYHMLSQCLSGPGSSSPETCAAADVVGDGDVDLHDFKFLQPAFDGPLFGDQDGDHDMDLDDYRLFADCITGVGAAGPPSCQAADLDENGRVDLYDFQLLQPLFEGASTWGS